MKKTIILLIFYSSLYLFTSCTTNEKQGNDIPNVAVLDSLSNTDLELQILNNEISGTGANAENYFQRAQLYLQLNTTEAAENDINKAIKLEPNTTIFYMVKAKIRYAKKAYNEALETAQKAELLGYKNPELYNLIGTLYLQQKNLKKAKDYINLALQSAPNHSENYALLGAYKMITKDSLSAINHYLKAINLSPNNKGAYVQLASLYNAYGNFEKAFEIGKNLEKQYPNDLSNLVNLAEGYRKIGANDSAMVYYKKINSLDKKNAEANLQLGLYNMKKQQFNQAYQYFTVAYNNKTKSKEIQQLLAMAAEFSGKWQVALEHYILAVSVDAANKKAQDGKKRMENKIYGAIPNQYNNTIDSLNN